MGPLVVVLLHPLDADLLDLFEGVKEIRIQHFVPEGPIKPFHKGILIRLAGLNVPQVDPALRTPPGKALRQKLRPVIEAEGPQLTSPGHDLLQDPHHPRGREGGIYFNGYGLADPFIEDIAGAEAPPAVQGVTHEVDTPHHIGLPHPAQHPRLGPAGQVSVGVGSTPATAAYDSTDVHQAVTDHHTSRIPSAASPPPTS